jgi:acetoin utilization deacetylase AcuC-like enzyme
MRVALYDHPSLTRHQPGPLHPERPARVIAVREALETSGVLRHLQPQEAPLVSPELVRLVHAPEVLDALRATAGVEATRFDADTVASASSFEAAMASAGGAVDATQRVLRGEIDSAFVIARPPGHHAEHDRPMGFCFLNNVAIAAKAAQQSGRAPRVCILDWDVHHGNGTQWTFYDDPSVLYVSLHRFPFYPGTGAAEEVGSGAGGGKTLNIPFTEGQTDAVYHAAFERVILPKMRAFQPSLVIVSAGYDAHERDPLGGMRLTHGAYANMTRLLVDFCKETGAAGPVLVLEGGYALDGLAQSAVASVEQLLQPMYEISDVIISEHVKQELDALRRLPGL